MTAPDRDHLPDPPGAAYPAIQPHEVDDFTALAGTLFEQAMEDRDAAEAESELGAEKPSMDDEIRAEVAAARKAFRRASAWIIERRGWIG